MSENVSENAFIDFCYNIGETLRPKIVATTRGGGGNSSSGSDSEYQEAMQADLVAIQSYALKQKVIEWIKSDKPCPKDALLRI